MTSIFKAEKKSAFTMFKASVSNKNEDIHWELEGGLRDGFSLVDLYSNSLLASESKQREKWYSLTNHYHLYGSAQLNRLTKQTSVTSRSNNNKWNGEKITMWLTGQHRSFECDDFKIIHRDNWNHLEIKTQEPNSIEKTILASYFCFWYWHRHYTQEGGYYSAMGNFQ